MKKIIKTLLMMFILLLGCGMTSIATTGTTLSVGDIVVVAINGDIDATNSYGRGFSFMPLVNLDAGTVINFTDYGWSDVNTAFISNTGIADAFIHYTVPTGGITAGTIIRCDSYHNTNFTYDYSFSGTGNNPYLNLGGLSQSDELLIFTGTRTSPTFIFAVTYVSSDILSTGWATSVSANGTDGSGAGSALPPGLTNDVTALSFNQPATANDNSAYKGTTTSATKAGWLTLLDNYSNWNFSEVAPIPTPPVGPYTVTGTATAPTVTTEAVSSIASTTATGNGTITSLGVPNPTAYGVCWNTTGTPTTSDSKKDNGTASTTGAFTASMTSLSANTTYHVRAFATNTAGTSYGSEVTFTTSAIAPTVTTQAASSITSTTAIGNGNITSLGVPNPTAYGVCWNTTGTPTTSDSKADNGTASATGAFTASMTSLSANTTYHVRAFATNTAGTSYGTEVSFTTSAVAPTVTTQAASSITSTTATGNGNITSLGVPNPTAYGVCWDTTGTPTTSDSKADNGTASATGAFTASMTSLTANTTYHVRAFATNTAGTSYGSEVTFTTLSDNLIVTSSDFTAGDDVASFDKTYKFTSFKFTQTSHNYTSMEPDGGFDGYYSFDYSTSNGTEFTISAPGYSFDLSSFEYYVDDTRLPSLNITITYTDGTTDTKTYSFTGKSSGSYTLSSFTTAVNDVVCIKFVTDNYMTFNSFAISDIKALPCTWNGTSWSPSAPTANDDAILDANYNSTGITCHDLTINSGFQVTFSSDVTVAGNLLVKSGATIINDGTINVTGTTTVQQALTGAGTTTPNGRFWYVASPVTGATSTTFDAAGNNKLWNYKETSHAYSEITDNTTTLSVGTGYVARLGADETASFTGTLTSGNVTLVPTRSGTTDTKRGYNLIGNPYLSYLDWNTAYTSTSNMLSTIWYRTVNASGTLLFDTYSALGVGTNNNGFGAVTGYIPPMQAFWVKVDGDGNTGALTFTNSMRSHQTGSLKENNALPVIRLAVSNGTNSDEAVAVFANEASNGYDKFDSPKMSNNNVHVPELYMQADSEKVAINGLRTFTGNDSIAVGFHAFEKGTFAVSLHEFSGLDGYTAVLFDNVTKKSTDLSTGDEYSFVADSSDNASRFTLVLKSGTETTGITAVTAKGISVSQKNGAIVVTTAVVPATVTISDVLGRVISSSRIASSPASIDVPATGIYFVTVASGTTFETVKVVIQK